MRKIKKKLDIINKINDDSESKKEFLNNIILESLNESEREKEQILNSLVDPVTFFSTDYKLKWINEAGLKKIPENSSVDEILNRKCYEVFHNRLSPCESCPVADTLRTGLPGKSEIEYKDGSTHLVSFQPLSDDNGDMKGIIAVEHDITIRKDIEKALERSQQRARALLDTIPDLMLLYNNAGLFIDHHFPDDFDIIDKNKIPEGRYLSELLPTELADSILRQTKNLSKIGEKRNFIFNDPAVDKDLFYSCRLTKTGINENVCIIQNISDQKLKELDIIQKSFRDSLTGLYNRAYFEEELKRIEKTRNILPVSVLVIDVNGLKLTNDAFGHDYGDKLLKKVSSILSSNCRKSDIIARIGGDEFSIILHKSPLSKAIELSDRIIESCRNSSYDDIFARPSVSIGCAEKNDKSENITDIFKKADEHMYSVKIENRSSHFKELINDIIKTMKNQESLNSGHIERCSKLAEKFAEQINMSGESIDKLGKLALMHDIGNIRISNSILQKRTKLSHKEIEELKEHPIIGYRIAKAIDEYAQIAELILYHHERWDGQGYPSGLAGHDIPMLSRLFSIIDSYDIMINGSAYKSSMSFEESINEIKMKSGKQFDPELSAKFINFIKREHDGKRS